MIKYKEGYKYQIIETYTVQTNITPQEDVNHSGWVTLSKEGVLTIKAGYAWDGPSGPTIDTKNFMRGSLIHDALYQLLREGLLGMEWFDASNDELWEACRADGMSWLRAWYVYAGVQRFGRQFAAPQETVIVTAP